jgi:hypothetical protein
LHLGTDNHRVGKVGLGNRQIGVGRETQIIAVDSEGSASRKTVRMFYFIRVLCP